MSHAHDHSTGEITYKLLRSRGFRIEYPTFGPDLHMSIRIDQPNSPIGRCDDYLELSPATTPHWHCWIRCDLSRRRGKFCHLRFISTLAQLEKLYLALTEKELPVEEVDAERFRETFGQMSAEAQKHWADYCSKNFRKDVVWME